MRFAVERKGWLPHAVVRAITTITVFAVGFMVPMSALGEDRLVVKDLSGTSTFTVDHRGSVFSADLYAAQGVNPGFWLDESGSGTKGAYVVLDSNWLQVQRRAQGFGAYEASPLFVHIGAPSLAVSVSENGYVGFGTMAGYPLHMASGAYCTTGGVWTNASSREYKKDIRALSSEEAMGALEGLTPVRFSYKDDSGEQHVGFIAEDVPDLVATGDRKGMSPMDVVAVLTRVVQEQQKTIAALSRKMALLEKEDR
jgi:hypothetical protein